MTIGFVTNADFLLQFYEISVELGLETEEEKTLLLMHMAKSNPDQCSVFKTERGKDQIVKDFAKNFGKVLRIKSEEG